ncbi:hypothetical protein M9H77_22765 [Catharanthus roseus]|uniref:Uncharacterized protein n=1 Tax=Catharanthus roseus TaxID=4058 RepID=A0ACC0ASM8_CATRO|nr:hypothetical protein M9H77_22765 [Catharanthus roseus]
MPRGQDRRSLLRGEAPIPSQVTLLSPSMAKQPIAIYSISNPLLYQPTVSGLDLSTSLLLPLSGPLRVGYENPREATSRIVCAHCHLANKPVDIKVPQAIYCLNKKNILVIGPVPGQKYSEITFPILPPTLLLKKMFSLLKVSYIRRREQGKGSDISDESKSNNTVYNATTAGIGREGFEKTIADLDGCQVVDIILPGPELLVLEVESMKLDQPLTSNPNVGKFGHGDVEIVLQDPSRVQGLLFFLASVILAQIFFVLKKKQFEKVQLAEMNF